MPKRPWTTTPGGRPALRGKDLRIGDELISISNTPERLTHFEPYDPTRIGLPPEAGWRIGYSGTRGPSEHGTTLEANLAYAILLDPRDREDYATWLVQTYGTPEQRAAAEQAAYDALYAEKFGDGS